MIQKQIDLERLKQNLQQIKLPAEAIRVPGAIGQDDLEEAYHLSAAVLTTFDPWQLRPFRQKEAANGPAVEHLLANCTLRYDEQSRPRWSLNHSPRKQALARLGTRERIQAALETAGTRPTDRLQALFESYVHDTAEPLAQQSLADLRHSLQIVDWLSGTALAAGLPSPAAVQARITWEELLQPFRYLVRDGFHGREEVLAQLHEHVASKNRPAPLLIFGPGGVGKSTLLAEFILQQAERRPVSGRLPFSYIDFDQAFIDAREPLTLLMAAAQQLAAQYPAAAAQCQEFVQEWSYRLASEGMRSEQNIIVEQKMRPSESGWYTSGVATKGIRPHGQLRQIDRYTTDFGDLLDQLAPGDRPWLLVLDTFEELQLYSRDLVTVIGDFLLRLGQSVPQARVIIAGRAQIEELSNGAIESKNVGGDDAAGGLAVTPLELEGFDETAAVAFLHKQGITDPAIAHQVFQAVTGNPLSLKLAARVVNQETLAGGSGQSDVAAVQNLLRKVAEGNIQGQLYRRVLDHISDPEVRKLAHPGLTLRLITPDLIEQVLAGPCEVAVRQNTDDAQRLFDLLSQEVSLVTPAGHNVLRHRPDVRAVMIAALHNDRPLVVHAIHKAAVSYYEQREGAEERAEEIYHRLFVERDFSAIDARWEPQFHETLAQQLGPALDEFTPRARTWLAARLGLTGVEDVNWDESDLPEWESYIEKRVRDRIQSNDWTGALELLGERRERCVGSRLYFLETVILRQQNRWQEARRCAYDGLYSLKMAGDEVGLLDLLRQAIAIDLHLGHLVQAQAGLAQARRLLAAQPDADEIVALELDLMALKIGREQAATPAEMIARIRAGILQHFLKLPDTGLLTHPELIREVLAEFGGESLDVLRRGLNLMTLGEPTTGERSRLAKVMLLWDLALSRTIGQSAGVLLREVDKSQHHALAQEWQTYVQHSNARLLNRDIERLLERFGRIESTVAVGLDALGEVAPGIRPVAVGDTGVMIIGGVIGAIIAGEKKDES